MSHKPLRREDQKRGKSGGAFSSNVFVLAEVPSRLDPQGRCSVSLGFGDEAGATVRHLGVLSRQHQRSRKGGKSEEHGVPEAKGRKYHGEE